LATTRSSQLTITIDVADQRQTVNGFGASDCWSAQYIGQWPSAKQNAIADLLFETGLDANNNPLGAGLSIWRMNVGAGSARQNNIDEGRQRATKQYR
jgi:O-glycosyl hydrolase